MKSMTSNKFIEIEGLHLNINNKKIISNFSLVLKKGDRIGITGPSGCGKTTLLKNIVSKKKPIDCVFYKYKIEIEGKIGYIPQAEGLLPWFTVKKNMDIYSEGDVVLYKQIIKCFEIESCMNSYPSEVSGGEHQRILIACSIFTKPDVFIADEPLTEVDLVKKWKILQYWSEYIERLKSSLIMVSHDIDTLMFMCDEVIIMSKKPSEVLKRIKINYKHPRGQNIVLDSNIRGEIIDVIKGEAKKYHDK